MNVSVADVIEEIKLRIPSDFDNNQLMIILNSSINEIGDVLAKESIWHSRTQKNVSIYTLPDIITFSNIISLCVDSVKYRYKNHDDYVNNYSFFKVSERQIAIYPEPIQEKNITINFRKFPQPVSITDTLSYEPQILHLIKLITMCNIAKSLFDTDTANNYIDEFNQLILQIEKSRNLSLHAYPKVKFVQGKNRSRQAFPQN